MLEDSGNRFVIAGFVIIEADGIFCMALPTPVKSLNELSELWSPILRAERPPPPDLYPEDPAECVMIADIAAAERLPDVSTPEPSLFSLAAS